MRKEIVAKTMEPTSSSSGQWLDLEAQGLVRLTSEDATHPFEWALHDRDGGGWQAAQPGSQTIWITFDAPQVIREIHLRFDAAEARTQEFVLLSSIDNGRSYQEIVRQQFNFSPGAARTEEENYFPHLDGVTDLKLTIVPNISGGDARASLRALRIR